MGARIAIALAAIAVVPTTFMLVVLAALAGAPQPGGAATPRYGVSAFALADIPPHFLELYQAAGIRYRLDWAVLAAIGKVETDHQRSRAPGVRSGVNAHGCCGGPMQFWIAPPHPNTWDRHGVDGNDDGRRDPYEPADAIPAAARYLRASGAPQDWRRALFAYNHAGWYVDQVLAMADRYRADPGRPLTIHRASVDHVLANPRVRLTPAQRGDLRNGRIDPRIVALLAAIGRSHTITVTALRSDHRTTTASGRRSNHADGRAFDFGAVDGETCRGIRTGACAQLIRELAAVEGPLRATELIYCFDPDGPADPRGFARPDHCTHGHLGFDR